METWLQFYVKLLRKKYFVKLGLSWGKFWPLRSLGRNLHIFQDNFEFRVEEEKKLIRENCFENVVSEIYQKNLFLAKNLPKILNVFMVLHLNFFLVFALFSKSSFVNI